MSSSGVFSAAQLAAKHAFLSEIIKEQQQQPAAVPSYPTPAPLSSASSSPSALASANVDKPSTTPGPLLTPPSSPDESPYLVDNMNFVPTVTNAKEFLDATVTWLGRPMTNGEAIDEISRLLLAEMSTNEKGVSKSLIKDLAQVVTDELKFVKTDKDITIHKTVAKEDAANPTAPRDTTSETEPETVVSIRWTETETQEDTTTTKSTPPASEHNDEHPEDNNNNNGDNNNNNNDDGENIFAGINWDDWIVCKQNGEMVMILRSEYVSRPRPSFYPSAEELARREAIKREDREQRRRYRRVF